jgi:hypothetical protein
MNGSNEQVYENNWNDWEELPFHCGPLLFEAANLAQGGFKPYLVK